MPTSDEDDRSPRGTAAHGEHERSLLATPSTVSLAEKRRLLLLVRTGLTLAIGYLLLFSSDGPARPPQLIFSVVYLASNVLLAAAPLRLLNYASFDAALVIIDTAAISFALNLLPQVDADVFIFYFAIILLAAISDRLALSLLAPVVVSLAYIVYLQSRGELMLQPAVLLRVPFFLLAGTFYGFLVDRVRRGRAAALAAAQREKARTEFMSLITHDLKQPLWVAQQSAALLYDKLETRAAEERSLVAQVMVNLRRMESLAQNFLEFDRIELKGVKVLPRAASLNRVVDDLISTYRPAFELKGLHVVLELDPALPPAWIDPAQIDRALSNLLDNAVKYCSDGGQIVCRTSTDTNAAVLTIGDDGPGISPDKVDTLFTRFQNGTDAAGRRSTGLGLYISSAIIEAHGGGIALDVTAHNGAWFVIRLPLAQKRTARRAADPAESARYETTTAAVGETAA